MLQEAEVWHTAHINRVAADQAKAAAATSAEQFKTILPPPALLTDGDMEEDEAVDKRGGRPHTSAFHSRTRPPPARLSGASHAPLYLRSSPTSLTRAQRTRKHFCPQHWLLCHLGLY